MTYLRYEIIVTYADGGPTSVHRYSTFKDFHIGILGLSSAKFLGTRAVTSFTTRHIRVTEKATEEETYVVGESASGVVVRKV
jgi:hypothetical protein